MPIHTYI